MTGIVLLKVESNIAVSIDPRAIKGECLSCAQVGHMAYQCLNKGKTDGSKKETSQGKAIALLSNSIHGEVDFPDLEVEEGNAQARQLAPDRRLEHEFGARC